MSQSFTGSEIAVVGMSGRFPGARNVYEFWGNLRDGIESIRRFTPEELIAAGVNSELLNDPDYVPVGAVLEDMESFDAGLFHFSPKDAAIMDPQHRHFLECSWEALEHAGHDPAKFNGSIGVYGGCGMNAYFMFNLLTNRELMDSVGMFLVRHTGNDKDFLCTRVSYSLNLRGPSVNVQTACSTSLVAIHIACQNLLNGECDMALAGGVTIEIPHRQGHLYRQGEILSKDGHCRAFDASATGTLFGSGVGVVVLRRLDDAIKDGDTIHAIIRASAINNDGSGKVGYLAPSVDGQAAVVAEALAIADVPAESISYIACHGTATQVGDPIEIEALTQAFRGSTNVRNFCGIGSVKTNIGHLDTAAGVASFIAAVLALQNRQLPPSLHFERPNPLIDFANSPFYVNAAIRDWVANPKWPRRAAVNSLGVGGTNAHLILEEAPEAAPTRINKSRYLLTISGKTATALEENSRRLAAYFRSHPTLNPCDAAFTLQVGRRALAHRRVVAVKDAPDAAAALERNDTRRVITQTAPDSEPSIIFMFPGGGAQYLRMGADLYREEPVYREAVDHCLRLFRSHSGADLHKMMFPGPGDFEAAALSLETPSLGLPALFITEFATAKLWMSWGIQPAALIAHSLGAYAQATIAGIMSVEDAISIVCLRGKLFDQLPEGSMLSVPLAEEELSNRISDRLNIAAVNGPALCTVSGRSTDIDELENRLKDESVECRRIKISVAAHSFMVEPILDAFREGVRKLKLNPPKIPIVSSLTGDWLTAEQATDPEFWVRKLRETVRFSAGITELLKAPNRVFLEAGPGQTLTSLVRLHKSKVPAYSSLRHPHEDISDVEVILNTLGRLWLSGVQVDWAKLYSERPRRIPLPTYAFDHQSYWIEAGNDSPNKNATVQEQSRRTEVKLEKIADIADWFYRPIWKDAPLPRATAAPAPGQRWLVFRDTFGFSELLVERLRQLDQNIIEVAEGTQYSRVGPSLYTVRAGIKEDFNALFDDLIGRGWMVSRIVHTWALAAENDPGRDRCFYSLLYLAQAIASQDIEQPVHISVVSNRLHAVDSRPPIHPQRATLLGPCKVIPQETPEITCQSIDLGLALDESGGPEDMIIAVDEVIREICGPSADMVVSLAAGRKTQSFERCKLVATKYGLREGGVYLITGGLGGIALALCEMLAGVGNTKLILVSRTPLALKPRVIQSLEAAGAEVLHLQADVTDVGQIAHAVRTAKERFGIIHGVVHAAGVLEDGPFQIKTKESAERVLAPKITGTLALVSALENETLDFFTVFSSTSSLLGPAGQIDYVAANAFLDAFAVSPAAQRIPITAINWGVWNGVGMAARLLPKVQSEEFEGVVEQTPDRLVYSRVLSSNSWPLDEHRVKRGGAVLPGTVYVELVRATAAAANVPGPEIQNLYFLSPLHVPEGASTEIRATLTKSGDGYHCLVTSRAGDNWMEHAMCDLLPLTSTAVVAAPSLDSLRKRCRTRQTVSVEAPYTAQGRHISFGPRWDCLRGVEAGKSEAIAEIELKDEFTSDLNTFKVHPALLDMATGYGLPLVSGYGPDSPLYIPLCYRRIRIFGDLPRRFYSHITSRNENTERQEVATFDVTLFDADGRVLVSVEEFTVRKSDAAAIALQPQLPATPPATKTPQIVEVLLKHGIEPGEGAEAFRRVLDSAFLPQVVVLSLNPLRLQEEMRLRSRQVTRNPRTLEGARADGPSNDVEKYLVNLWQDLLGCDYVGVDDDFFELGGHSLIAVRLFAKLKKVYKVDLGLATLFTARTPRQLSALLPQKDKEEITNRESVKPPLFVVHDGRNDVDELRTLVAQLGRDQRVYTLQTHATNGDLPRVEEMASRYINEVRRVQPEGPYYLLASSTGGMVAFAMAQQLHAGNQEIGMLGLLDNARVNPNLGSRLMRFVKRTLRSEHQSEITAARYSGRAILFRACKQTEAELYDDSYLRWKELAVGGLEVQEIQGNHMLAQAISACIDRSFSGATPDVR